MAQILDAGNKEEITCTFEYNLILQRMKKNATYNLHVLEYSCRLMDDLKKNSLMHIAANYLSKLFGTIRIATCGFS